MQLNGTNRHSRDSMRQEEMNDDENGKKLHIEEREEDGEGTTSGNKFYLLKKS